MQSSHNIHLDDPCLWYAQKYHNISKNAIKSQLPMMQYRLHLRAKIPQYFKECNQVTTPLFYRIYRLSRKNTTIFQRMQSSHNNLSFGCEFCFAQKYHNISKNAIKSQQTVTSSFLFSGAKIPQYFKECNQVTTPPPSPPIPLRAKIPQYFKECNQVTTMFYSVFFYNMRKNTTIFQRMQSSHNVVVFVDFY